MEMIIFSSSFFGIFFSFVFNSMRSIVSHHFYLRSFFSFISTFFRFEINWTTLDGFSICDLVIFISISIRHCNSHSLSLLAYCSGGFGCQVYASQIEFVSLTHYSFNSIFSPLLFVNFTQKKILTTIRFMIGETIT